MRWALTASGLRWAGALALALAASSLSACGAENDEAGGMAGPFPRDWFSGGQTGSLMPACGLSAETIESGVPASAPGLVLRTDAMGCDADAFEALTVRDASGQMVAFSLFRLPDGSLLINIEGGLTPGRYSIDVGAPLPADGGAVPLDEDGGLEPDAAIVMPLPDAGVMEAPLATVEVEEQLPRPQRFGMIERLGDSCNADLTFIPDPAVLPFLSVLSVELQIDQGPSEPLVRPGALSVGDDGVARVRLPTERIDDRGYGYHELRIVTRIAGENVPLETFLLSVEVPCGYQDDGQVSGDSYEADRCAVSGPGARGGSRASSVLLALALYALRRRRRRKR